MKFQPTQESGYPPLKAWWKDGSSVLWSSLTTSLMTKLQAGPWRIRVQTALLQAFEKFISLHTMEWTETVSPLSSFSHTLYKSYVCILFVQKIQQWMSKKQLTLQLKSKYVQLHSTVLEKIYCAAQTSVTLSFLRFKVDSYFLLPPSVLRGGGGGGWDRVHCPLHDSCVSATSGDQT